MSVNCLFFGQLADDVGCRSIVVHSASEYFSINQLIELIAVEQTSDFAAKLKQSSITVAVNQTVEHDYQKQLSGVAEVAFFPPVTGG